MIQHRHQAILKHELYRIVDMAATVNMMFIRLLGQRNDAVWNERSPDSEDKERY